MAEYATLSFKISVAKDEAHPTDNLFSVTRAHYNTREGLRAPAIGAALDSLTAAPLAVPTVQAQPPRQLPPPPTGNYSGNQGNDNVFGSNNIDISVEVNSGTDSGARNRPPLSVFGVGEAGIIRTPESYLVKN